MAYAYTSDVLITQVKRRGMIPSSDNTLASADYISFINDEIQTSLVPLVMSTREEFYVANSDVSLTGGTASYPIPSRAIGAKLRNVQILTGTEYATLSRLEPENVASGVSGAPEGFYLQGNNVVVYPTPSSSGTLRLSYFIRPNRVVALTECSVIATLPGSQVVTVTTAGSAFPTTSIGYDFIKATGPGFECHSIDALATRSTTTLTFAAALPSALAVGDYIALAGETPIPQIPVELHPLLAERVVVRALMALGDPKVAVHEASADRMQKAALTLLTPRSEGSTRRILNFNAPGWGRRPRGWR
jgi:hypothetical protein